MKGVTVENGSEVIDFFVNDDLFHSGSGSRGGGVVDFRCFEMEAERVCCPLLTVEEVVLVNPIFWTGTSGGGAGEYADDGNRP